MVNSRANQKMRPVDKSDPYPYASRYEVFQPGDWVRLLACPPWKNARLVATAKFIPGQVYLVVDAPKHPNVGVDMGAHEIIIKTDDGHKGIFLSILLCRVPEPPVSEGIRP